MAPFSIPVPAIIPLRLPLFGGPKSIDTNTKIQLLCQTYIDHEVFYTLDGTKPQPYAGIVQGNKTLKYTSPFCLPAGKITVKALAINSCVHTMCSSVVTKCFEVIKIEPENNKIISKAKYQRTSTMKRKTEISENKRNLNKKTSVPEKKISDVAENKLDSEAIKDEPHSNCMEVAFIGASDFDIENSDLENSVEDEGGFPFEDVPDGNNNGRESEDILLHEIEGAKDSFCEAMEKLALEDEKNMGKSNTTLADSGTSTDTQFCCLKCDLTLQHCSSCNKMNAVSSKFCIECGQPLLLLCAFCKKYNASVAAFCQFCGRKLGTRLEPLIKGDQIDHAVMAKPESKNAGIQELPVTIDKCTQTSNVKSPVKRRPDIKQMPDHSPGRGYWHQQLDYICNHLKSHAYNNVEFRKEIGEPSLHNFKSAFISKQEDAISVTVVFTPFVPDKNISTSEEMKSEDKKQDST